MKANYVKLYLVRHGQTYLNRYDRIQGWADSPLTESGVNDAVKTGQGLKDVKFKKVYSSDLLRASQTAKLILAQNQSGEVELETMSQLREQFFGSFEGQSAQEHWGNVYSVAEKLYDKQDFSKLSPIKIQMDLFNALDPYGDAEDFDQFWSRVWDGLSQIVQAHRESGDNILVVSHGLAIRNIVHELCPQFDIPGFLDNGALTVLRYQDGLFHVDEYNKTF